MPEPPQQPAGTVRQIRDRCAAALDSISHTLCCKCTGEEKKICSFRQEDPQRAAFADISLKEQGEIRAPQEGWGWEANSARPSASLSCQVAGRPPKYDLELLLGLRPMV